MGLLANLIFCAIPDPTKIIPISHPIPVEMLCLSLSHGESRSHAHM